MLSVLLVVYMCRSGLVHAWYGDRGRVVKPADQHTPLCVQLSVHTSLQYYNSYIIHDSCRHMSWAAVQRTRMLDATTLLHS